MARLNMSKPQLTNALGNAGDRTTARGCITELRSHFHEIESNVQSLRDVWVDEGQRIFMSDFEGYSKAVTKYLSDLENLLNDMSNAVKSIDDWDQNLKRNLDNLY